MEVIIIKTIDKTHFITNIGELEWQFAPEGTDTEYILQDIKTGEIYEIIESIVDDDFNLLGYLGCVSKVFFGINYGV